MLLAGWVEATADATAIRRRVIALLVHVETEHTIGRQVGGIHGSGNPITTLLHGLHAALRGIAALRCQYGRGRYGTVTGIDYLGR